MAKIGGGLSACPTGGLHNVDEDPPE